jgi:hypothetical protein
VVSVTDPYGSILGFLNRAHAIIQENKHGLPQWSDSLRPMTAETLGSNPTGVMDGCQRSFCVVLCR